MSEPSSTFTLSVALSVVALYASGCESASGEEPWTPTVQTTTGGELPSTGPSTGTATASTGMPGSDTATTAGSATGTSGGIPSGELDASVMPGTGLPPMGDAAAPIDGPMSDAASGDSALADGSVSVDGEVPLDAESDAAQEVDPTCELPTTYKWTGSAPLAQPKNGSVSMKDFTHVIHNGQHILYFTTFDNNWGSAMMTFDDWPDAAEAPQQRTAFGVAPTLFYFTPKELWVLAYQWGPHKFSYRTSKDPTNPNGWSGESSLYNTPLPPNGTGPIDQTVICDSAKCFLYYAGDNGHIYKSSMPIESFPGEFPGAQDSGIVGTTQNLFEGVQVYRVKGSDTYLMIVEAQGNGRYFRAWTATDLEGPWNHLTDEFAIKKNVSFTTDWTNDISHGDIVRENPDETFTIDPCNLQMVFQGRDPRVNTSYGKLPYRLGLITHERE